MTKRIPTNVAASVRQRLYNLAKEKQEDFNFVLGRFVAERLLFRLSVSENGSDFVLKGALLFLLWSDHLCRPTRDVDLLGYPVSVHQTLRRSRTAWDTLWVVRCFFSQLASNNSTRCNSAASRDRRLNLRQGVWTASSGKRSPRRCS